MRLGRDNDAQNSWQSELFKPPASAAERREMLKLAPDASGLASNLMRWTYCRPPQTRG